METEIGVLCFEDGERPQTVGSVGNLGKAGKQIVPLSLQKEAGLPTP